MRRRMSDRSCQYILNAVALPTLSIDPAQEDSGWRIEDGGAPVRHFPSSILHLPASNSVLQTATSHHRPYDDATDRPLTFPRSHRLHTPAEFSAVFDARTRE